MISLEEVILNFLNNKITIVNGYFLRTSLVDVTRDDYFELKPMLNGLNLVYSTFCTPGHPLHEVDWCILVGFITEYAGLYQPNGRLEVSECVIMG